VYTQYIHTHPTYIYICVRRGERERASESNYENKSQNKLIYVIILLITRRKRFYFSLFCYVRKRETRFLWKKESSRCRDDLEDLAATHEISVFLFLTVRDSFYKIRLRENYLPLCINGFIYRYGFAGYASKLDTISWIILSFYLFHTHMYLRVYIRIRHVVVG